MKKTLPKIRAVILHKRFRLNSPLLKRLVSAILKSVGGTGLKELEIVFIEGASMRRLNKRFKKHDRSTDVLSFPLGDTATIFISIDQAGKNSRLYATSLEEEAIIYLIHGVLHLTGYNDLNANDARRMSARQENILERLWQNHDLSKVLTRR